MDYEFECYLKVSKELITYLNQPFFLVGFLGDVIKFEESSFLPFIIIKGTIAHRARNKIQNK